MMRLRLWFWEAVAYITGLVARPWAWCSESAGGRAYDLWLRINDE